MLICPHCRQAHQYLRDLLTCCPRELRAVTEALYAVSGLSLSLASVLTGYPLPPRLVAVMTAEPLR